MTTRAILITVVLMLGGCGGSTGGVDGGADALEQDGQDVSEGDAGSVDQAPADVQSDAAPADAAPGDEGGQDTAPADRPPVDVARDMGQPDSPPADVQPADVQPADMAPDLSLPENDYTCRTLATGHPSVRAVNGETLRIDCDNASLDEAVCQLTATGQRYCFLCVRCDMPPSPFCSQQPTVRLLTYDFACAGTGDEFCLYEERPVACETCENNTCR